MVGNRIKNDWKRIVNTFKSVESPVVKSVRAREKSDDDKFPLSRILLVGLLVVLLVFAARQSLGLISQVSQERGSDRLSQLRAALGAEIRVPFFSAADHDALLLLLRGTL